MSGANHIFPKNGSEIFLRERLDRPSSLKSLGKLDIKIFARRWPGPVRVVQFVCKIARRRANHN